jgi:predicted GIY-YIG superfamily endonuclease
LVERVLGKDEVIGSIPINGSRFLKYFVYVLRSIPSGRHYIGRTSDPVRRLHEHNTKKKRWTSAFQPWSLSLLRNLRTPRELALEKRF